MGRVFYEMKTVAIQKGLRLQEAGVEAISAYLHKNLKQELVGGYNRYVKRIEAKNISPDRKEKLIIPERDIITLVSESRKCKGC